ncbi:MAG: SurA N-terminal domain-containing protein [Proteobacteria bacterium]|nr:SurA N-terminal domain-containing protein [Pseudomonadota bacterium]MBU1058656.1 SurA N-terminal domain-containing protein [Pseudomonadota bacterium]
MINFFSACSFSRLRTTALFVLFTSLAITNVEAAELVDRVVAVVNDDVITMSEVNEEGKGFFQKIREQAPSSQLEEALREGREEVLNNLIDKKLINQVAAKQNVSISDEELRAAAEQMLVNNKITRETLDAQLAQMGMSYEAYLSTLRNQILQSKLVNYEIRSKIIITDNMVLDYYDTHYTKHVSQGGYYLMQMGFIWAKDSTTSSSQPASYAAKVDAQKRAERVRALVLSGEDFRTLAQKFSDLPSARDGGDLGVFEADEMAPYMRDAVLTLTPGEVSEIIETPSGYQFFKLLSSQDGQIVVQASFESVKEEIRNKLYEQELKGEFDNWVKKLKEDAYIKKL